MKPHKKTTHTNPLHRVYRILRITVACEVLLILAGAWAFVGCQRVPDFPRRARWVSMTPDYLQVYTYDRDGDGKDDYRQIFDRQGRKNELLFDIEAAAPEQVLLDQLDPAQTPHFIIALDGVPFELVASLYQDGCFRLFYPPSRMISTFPSMTDLAYSRIFGGKRPPAFQAKHFNPRKNRIVEGNELYLSGAMADWASRLDYRVSFKMDALAYVMPEQIFEHELRNMREVLLNTTKDTAIVYSVATAGLGTQGGREAILKYLRQVDCFCEELVYERRGRVKITLLADHGHNMSGRGWVTFDEMLAKAGFRPVHELHEPQDVVAVKFGLISYAAFFTRQPDKVATVLLHDPATALACYPQDDGVVVQTLDGKARIFHDAGRYRYAVEYGDPLQLGPILATLRAQGHVDAAGYIDDRALFEATIEHEYPDPLHRLWDGFHGLVEMPADLVVCLKDGWCHGSRFYHAVIGGATSTHGSLNRINTTAFVLSMWGSLPPALRPEDVMPALEALRQKR
ncbi:MAG: hypothetical protein JW810_05535 [Sedimentisphaerales bacterium]|nr:hypothetical protein [Sedimentisphaerales bacterium]